MNFLQFFLILSGIIILISALDIARRERFHLLHVLIFIGIGGGLILFTIFPNILTSIGNLFGLQRGADLLVYTSIIFLIYFLLSFIRKNEKQEETITKIVREIAFGNVEKVLDARHDSGKIGSTKVGERGKVLDARHDSGELGHTKRS